MPHEKNQPFTSFSVTIEKAFVIAFDSSSCVLADIPRSNSFILLHIFSIGLKSGLYGGKNLTIAHFFLINSRASEL